MTFERKKQNKVTDTLADNEKNMHKVYENFYKSFTLIRVLKAEAVAWNACRYL